MSYFKYAERSSESRVDWNEISKGMVDMLKEQTRLRNEKLDEAAKLQGEVTTTLSEAPMGSDVNANQRVSQFAADAQEYSLMMNKLWRSGEMSYREYMAATNNFKTNTEGYLSQAEKYAANYEKHVKRMEEQLASGVEVSELARVEDFGNFSKFTPVIDAPTGSIGLVGEDGTKYASVTQLGVAVMSQYDRLDVEGRTTDVAKQMTNTVKVIKAGGVRTLESALQNADYVAAEDDAVSGILIGDNAHTSVLVDFKRGLYSTTHDINDAINDPNAILMVPSSRNSDRMIGAIEDDAAFERYIDEQATRNGQPLTPGEKATLRRHRDAQREQSFETVREQLRARLDWEETPTADTDRRGLTDAERKRQQGVSVTQDGVDNLQAIFTAKDADTLEGALSYFEAKNPDIDLEVVQRGGERQLAILREGEDETRYVTIGRNLEDYNKFVEAAGAYVIPNTEYLSEVLERTPLGEGATVGTQLGAVRSGRVVENLLTEEIELAGENVPFGSIPLSGASEAFISDDDAQNAVANANYNKIMTGLSQLGDAVASLNITPVSVGDVDDKAGVDQPALMIFDESKMEYPVYVSQGKSEVGRTMAVLEMVYNTQGNVDMGALMQLLGDDSRTITNSFNNMSGAEAAPSGKLSWAEWSAQNPNGTPQEYRAYYDAQ